MRSNGRVCCEQWSGLLTAVVVGGAQSNSRSCWKHRWEVLGATVGGARTNGSDCLEQLWWLLGATLGLLGWLETTVRGAGSCLSAVSLSVCLPVCLSACLSVCLSVCPLFVACLSLARRLSLVRLSSVSCPSLVCLPFVCRLSFACRCLPVVRLRLYLVCLSSASRLAPDGL